MYEDGKKSLSLNWGSLAVKLVILAVIVFIAGWIFVKVTGNNSSSSKNTLADSNSEYINNINTMKTAAFEYFTKSKLPEKVGATEKVTLAQMINQKLLIDFTSDGKTCDTNSSYVQTTKTADGNYALKVSLTCGDESDFIVTTIEKDSCENNTCTTDTKTNTDVVDTKKNTTTNTTTNNTSTNTSTNTNKSNSSTTTNNTNKTNSSSASTNTSTSTTTKTTVTTKVTIKITCTSGCCETNCNNNTDTKKDDKTDTTPTPTPTPTPTKVRYYKYIKYSDWSKGYSSASNAENKKQTVTTYNYCKEYEQTYYSTGYVADWTKVGKYSYEVQFTDLPSDVNSVAVVNSSKSYFGSSTSDYQAYINNRGSLYMTGNNNKANVTVTNAYAFRNSSLTKNNFTFEVSGAYYSKTQKNWATTITINYKNLNGVTPYYASNLNSNVYFVPLKFDISYSRDKTCVRDYESNKNKYTNYSISDPETETTWMHRTYEYTWSKETKLDGYTYTGQYEDRTE